MLQMEAGTKLILVQQPAHYGVQSLPWDDPATLDNLRILTSFHRDSSSQLPPKVFLLLGLHQLSDCVQSLTTAKSVSCRSCSKCFAAGQDGNLLPGPCYWDLLDIGIPSFSFKDLYSCPQP